MDAHPNAAPRAHFRQIIFCLLAVASLALVAPSRLAAQTISYIYQSGPQGNWINTDWGATANMAATTLGHSGTATIDAAIPAAWQGLALGDVGQGWSNLTNHYVNTTPPTVAPVPVTAPAEAVVVALRVSPTSVLLTCSFCCGA